MKKTKRTFENVETNKVFQLYFDPQSGNHSLIFEGSNDPEAPAKGTEVNGFYILAHTGGEIKLNTKKIVKLSSGQFYNLKEGEEVTHVKYTGFKRFRKASR